MFRLLHFQKIMIHCSSQMDFLVPLRWILMALGTVISSNHLLPSTTTPALISSTQERSWDRTGFWAKRNSTGRNHHVRNLNMKENWPLWMSINYKTLSQLGHQGNNLVISNRNHRLNIRFLEGLDQLQVLAMDVMFNLESLCNMITF